MKIRGAAAALLLATAAQAGDEPIDWRAAAQCVGEVCAVRGTIAGGDDKGSTVRLYFDETDHNTSVAIVRSWLDKFPDQPVAFYQGKTIVASGAVRRFRDTFEVLVRDEDDITIVEAEVAPTPSAYGTPEPSEIDTLKERLRDVERRMHDLEESK